jgi:hypothetical protein
MQCMPVLRPARSVNTLRKALLTVALAGSAVGVAYGGDAPLLSLTMDHFRDTATVKDDALDTVATISTQNGYQEKRGLLRIVWNDTFLRGFIDKATRRHSFQVYQLISYKAAGWRYYESANYQTPSGPRSTPVTVISRDVTDCSGGNCYYAEHIAFAVDEDLLRTIASSFVPGKAVLWQYKFIPKSGDDFIDGLSNAEVAGFLAKVDEYQKTLPAATTQQAAASASPATGSPTQVNCSQPAQGTPAPLRFGVRSAMVNQKMAELLHEPNVEGAYVVSVDVGSVADASGLRRGDVVLQVGGKLVTSICDISEYVSRLEKGSNVPITVWRAGTESVIHAQF